MKRVYKVLLRFYPKVYRSEFSEEMLTVFEHLWNERTDRGILSAIGFFTREIAGLVAGVGMERVRQSTASQRASISNLDELAEAERNVTFHLRQTIECIASHRFQGARFHAYEEQRAREMVRSLRASVAQEPDGDSV